MKQIAIFEEYFGVDDFLDKYEKSPRDNPQLGFLDFQGRNH